MLVVIPAESLLGNRLEMRYGSRLGQKATPIKRTFVVSHRLVHLNIQCCIQIERLFCVIIVKLFKNKLQSFPRPLL